MKTSSQQSAATDSASAQPQLATPAQTSGIAQASVPRLIRFSGSLQNLSGRAIAGPVDVTFSLYAEEAGGVPLWFETQTVQADALGHYSALLGAMSPAGVPVELFTEGQARWLGVMVQGLPEQSRVLLVSVPYALKAGDAETLGGKPAASYQLTPESTAASDSAAKQGTTTTRSKNLTNKSGSPTPQTLTATQNYIPVMTANDGSLGNSVMYQSSGYIGIGTTAPAFPFDLNNNVFAIGPKSSRPGAGGTMRFRDDSGTVRWLFGVPGTAGSQDFFMYNYANGHAPLYIQNGAASYSLYLSGNGNVGIGTTSPQNTLEVNGNIATNPNAGLWLNTARTSGIAD
ncbi:MAG TPA: hypothetical protein VFM21_06520, partial [Terriglobia bacterium]|nr:hypothetical protein [Terriglobia bacterium]